MSASSTEPAPNGVGVQANGAAANGTTEPGANGNSATKDQLKGAGGKVLPEPYK